MVPSSRITNDLVMLTIGSKVLVVLAAVVLSSSSLPAAGASVTTRQGGRFVSPCSGSRTMGSDFAPEVGHAEPEMSSAELSRTFEQLARNTDRLKKRVRDLKNQYVSKRFKDTKVVNDLDQVGFRLSGMPSTDPASVSSIGGAQAVSTVHDAFTDLAKVSVFIDQARMGEVLAENEHVTFEDDFATIEDHHEHGLYLILCALHKVTIGIGSPVSSDRHREILSLKVTEVDRNALRHTRDYLVLRDFERILGRLEVHFLALKQLHTP